MMPTLQLTLLSAAIAGALGFGSAWKIQSLRADSLEKTHVEQKLAQEQEARRFDQARTSALAAAQIAGAARQAVLRADADAVRRTLDGVRVTSALAVSAARASAPACLESATPNGALLDIITENARETEAALVELDGKADRHASDIKMMQDAWPR